MRAEQQIASAVFVGAVTYLLSSFIWWITKLLAKIGTILIPLLCSGAAFCVVRLVGQTNDALVVKLVLVPSMAVIVLLGILASWSCSLHANLHDLEQKTKILAATPPAVPSS